MMMMMMMRWITSATLDLLVLLSCVQASPAARHLRGATASESETCSTVGGRVLESGGNAADALVATTLCVGTIGMYHSGIGGGGFAIARGSDGEMECIDFRETAPQSAFEDMYQGNLNGSVFGGLSVAVPSELLGLEYIHSKYGRLPWASVVQPAEYLARHGFRVSEDLVRYANATITLLGRNFLVEDPLWAEDFAPHGTLLGIGETMTRRRYADTLREIAHHGSKAFYTGPIADSILESVNAANGSMTLEDLQSYQVKIRPALSINYRGIDIWTCPNPAAGPVVLGAMKIFEGYNWRDNEDAPLSTHRLDEATRFAYGARTELGDPAYVTGADDLEQLMIDRRYTQRIRQKISDDHTLNVTDYDPSGLEIHKSHGTSQITAADETGMAFSMTTTVNLLFGAELMTTTGIILNDEMDDFSIPGAKNAFGYPPAPANYIRAGKRPLSSMCPVILEVKGKFYSAAGAGGGSKIITTMIQHLWHLLDHPVTLAMALAKPRFHDQLIPNELQMEAGHDEAVIEAMHKKGHDVKVVPIVVTAVQAVRNIREGRWEAVGEPRQFNSGGYIA